MDSRHRAEQLHEEFRASMMKNEQPSIVEMLTKAFDDMKVEEEVVSPCSEHPTYKGKRKPRTGCEDCWRFYLYMKATK